MQTYGMTMTLNNDGEDLQKRYTEVLAVSMSNTKNIIMNELLREVLNPKTWELEVFFDEEN